MCSNTRRASETKRSNNTSTRGAKERHRLLGWLMSRPRAAAPPSPAGWRRPPPPPRAPPPPPSPALRRRTPAAPPARGTAQPPPRWPPAGATADATSAGGLRWRAAGGAHPHGVFRVAQHPGGALWLVVVGGLCGQAALQRGAGGGGARLLGGGGRGLRLGGGSLCGESASGRVALRPRTTPRACRFGEPQRARGHLLRQSHRRLRIALSLRACAA